MPKHRRLTESEEIHYAASGHVIPEVRTEMEETGRVFYVIDGEDTITKFADVPNSAEYDTWHEMRDSDGALLYCSEDGITLTAEEFGDTE